MRQLSLREQHPNPEQLLSKPELARLLSAGRRILSIGISSTGGDLYDLRTSSVVGTLVWPDLAVLIKPKVDIRNVFFLLGFRGRLVDWDDRSSFPYAQERDLFRAMAWIFDMEIRRGLRYGVARGYVGREEGLTMLRGRIAMARQLRMHQTRPLPLECDFQEYSEDITLNRVLSAALRHLRFLARLDPAIALSFRRSETAFTDVEQSAYSPPTVPDVTFNRLNQRWETAFRLAQMILRAKSLVDEFGNTQGVSFTVDMNTLFEKFLETIVGDEARRAGMVCTPQAPIQLTDELGMQPDLIIEAKGRQIAVGDAKYIEEPKEANFYQLLAYCVAMGLPRGLLIYAAPRPVKSYHVRKANIDLEVIGIDMGLPPRALEEEARAAARRLIAHAHWQQMAHAQAS